MSVRLFSGKGPRAGVAAPLPSGHTWHRGKAVRPVLAVGLALTAGVGLLGTFPAQADTPVSLTATQWSQVDAYSSANHALGVAADGSGALVRLPADRSKALVTPKHWNVSSLSTRSATAAGGGASTSTPVGTASGPAYVTVKKSRFAQGDITAMGNAVKHGLRPGGSTKYGLMTQYDAATDKIIVTTNAPSALTGPLVRTYGDKIKIESGKFEAQRGRYKDTIPLYGGISLTRGQAGDRCTGGVSVLRADTVYMTTAAHCYPVNPTQGVYNYMTGADYEQVGKVTNRYNEIDQELIARNVAPIRRAYAPRIWSGQTANALDALTVEGEMPAFLGLDNICVTGQTTHAHCGNKVVDMTPVSVCWPNTPICVRGGNSFLYRPDPCASCNVKFTQGGDSGAPIYKWTRNGHAKIVGLHTGVIWRNGVQHMLGVRIGAALNKMGTTLYTGP